MSYQLTELTKELIVDPETSLSLLKRKKGELRNIVASGFLHKRINLVDWINQAWELLGPKGTLWITVPYAENAWNDPFAVREVNETTFACFNVKDENYKEDCKPFQAVFMNRTGNDLHVRLVK